MKKKLVSYIIVLALIFTSVLAFSPAAYADYSGDTSVARLMPGTYTFTDSITISTPISQPFPPGRAKFDVVISGMYDFQGDNVMTIDSAECYFTSGVNVSSCDMHVKTWTTAADRGYVFWRLEGTITFEWTSPVTGTQYSSAFYYTPDNSFRVYDYANR